MNEEEVLALFKRWYVTPFNLLKQLPDGDGGWVAMMIGTALFERYIVALRQKEKSGTSEDPTKLSQQDEDNQDDDKKKIQKEEEKIIQKKMADYLGLTVEQQAAFWSIFRVGLHHYGMPKAGKRGFALHHSFSALPEFRWADGKEYVCIDPWKFTARILQEFLDNQSLLRVSKSFPWAGVGMLPPELLID